MNENFIEFRNISKSFPGQQALNNVSFSIRKGEIHALVGENGAGKSTLLNILNGVLPQTSGEVLIDGEKITFSSPQEAIFSGIAKVHQEIILVPEMTVMDNLFLGSESTRTGLLNRGKIRADTRELLDKLKCNFSPDDKVKELNVGEKQMLQIAKALHLNVKVISFDEPTSSLTNNEVNTLFHVIRQLQENGITILYITHKLDEIYHLCDRATILRDGEYIGTYDIEQLSKEDLIRKMVGRDVSMFAKRTHPSKAEWDKVVLRVQNLSGQKGYRDVSFDLHKGEILGFYGLVGAKRTETMLGVFGADMLTSGIVELNGRPVIIRSPNDATRNSIGLVPENRKEQGFIKDLKNMDNVCLASLDKFERGFFQNNRKKFENTKDVGKKVGLVPNDPEFYTTNLSGGNQQKVIIAKWLSTQADILIFDEPTKGIDVGSKSEIYHLMEELVSEGKSIIMISGELPEVIGMADRIVVMRDGEVSAILPKEEFDETKILAYAVGGKINELQKTV